MGSLGRIPRSLSTTIDGMIFPTPPDFLGSGDGCIAVDSLPVPRSRMIGIAFNALRATFHSVTCYDHTQVSQWNNQVIDLILADLIADTTDKSPDDQYPSKFKFMVTSSITQYTGPLPLTRLTPHLVDDTLPKTAEESGLLFTVDRPGRHWASKSYWDEERDGMWSYEWDAGPEKGFVVLILLYYTCYQD